MILGHLTRIGPGRFSAIARLYRLDPYSTSPIREGWLEGLRRDLPELITGLRDGMIDIAIPSELHDPDCGYSMPFGRGQFIVWAEDLLALCEQAIDLQVPLLALGD